ncbi:MAG: hypothetical protein HZA95_02940 [Candidatus Vogelbacteria bacterium]|nr:hypothetical protein [Candidatus Vogelbacteria bacterium]
MDEIKLQSRDFIPLYGMANYFRRNAENRLQGPYQFRQAILDVYNIAIGLGLGVACYTNALEKIVQ